MEPAASDNSVKVVPYNPGWALAFEAERERCLARMPAAKLEHIGSTAIPGLMAKPVVDMLAGVPAEMDIDAHIPVLAGLGYVLEGRRPGHAWLAYPSPRNRKYILHLVVFGQGEWTRRLAFRNRLRSDPGRALAYQELKLGLAREFHADLGAYTKAKSAFVKETISS